MVTTVIHSQHNMKLPSLDSTARLPASTPQSGLRVSATRMPWGKTVFRRTLAGLLVLLVAFVVPLMVTDPEPDSAHPAQLLLSKMAGCTNSQLLNVIGAKDSPFNRPGLPFRVALSDFECLGSTDILERIRQGVLQMGPVQYDALRDYDRKYPGACRVVDRLYDQYMIVIVAASCGAGSLEEIARRYATPGKRFSITTLSRQKSRGFVDLQKVLEYNGVKTPIIETADYEMAAHLFESGQTNAAFFFTSPKNPVVQRLARSPGARVISLSAPEEMVSKDSGLKAKSISAKTFGRGQPEDVQTLVTPCVWVASEQVSASVVAAFRDCLHANEGAMVHDLPFLKLKDPDSSAQPFLHPGVTRKREASRWWHSTKSLVRGAIHYVTALDPITKFLGSAITLFLALLTLYKNHNDRSGPGASPKPDAASLPSGPSAPPAGPEGAGPDAPPPVAPPSGTPSSPSQRPTADTVSLPDAPSPKPPSPNLVSEPLPTLKPIPGIRPRRGKRGRQGTRKPKKITPSSLAGRW